MPTNIRLGWKGFPETNVLAYYEKSKHTAIKSFVTLSIVGSGPTPKYYTRLERDVRPKYSGFFGLLISYVEKKFCVYDPCSGSREKTLIVLEKNT